MPEFQETLKRYLKYMLTRDHLSYEENLNLVAKEILNLCGDIAAKSRTATRLREKALRARKPERQQELLQEALKIEKTLFKLNEPMNIDTLTRTKGEHRTFGLEKFYY